MAIFWPAGVRCEADRDGLSVEEHCYFPEWAQREISAGSTHELDCNSYLAGGYAEEFGHRAPPPPREGLSRAGQDGAGQAQSGCLHPGYPESPRPLDPEPVRTGLERSVNAAPAVRAAGDRRAGVSIKVIRVGSTATADARRRPWTPWRELQIRRERLTLR